ncbi:MAG: RagB/SusD family nutrient uptake outer membrane protein, partial [Bacteroidales bacterium]|nr:RagB/SusD family nutrient uptake outer membrane protein [Bacteroidales bacterium]
GGYSLATAFGDLFDGNTTEPVFEVVFDAQNSNRLAQYFFARSLTGRYEVGPSNALMQGFDPADLRSANTFSLSADNVPYGIKYKDIVAGTDRVMVLRLAEMYLIRAEARAYTNGDIGAIRDDIDILRTRAGLPATTASDHESLKLAIENERRWEFAFEGQRWSDLVRTGRAVTVLGIDPDFMLFPIPLSELLTNKLMTPNPGY